MPQPIYMQTVDLAANDLTSTLADDASIALAVDAPDANRIDLVEVANHGPGVIEVRLDSTYATAPGTWSDVVVGGSVSVPCSCERVELRLSDATTARVTLYVYV